MVHFLASNTKRVQTIVKHVQLLQHQYLGTSVTWDPGPES